MKKGPSKAEVALLEELMARGLDPWPEYQFHESRRWRFDYAFPDEKVAVEVEGGVFIRGRHVSPAGFIGDCEKYNAAARLGWRVLRFPVVGSGWAQAAADEIAATLKEKP